MKFPSREFDQAVADICHGVISADQMCELTDLLRADEAACDAYILAVELHSRLASENALFVPANNAKPKSLKLPARPWLRWAGVAAAILIAAGGWLLFMHRGETVRPGVAIRVIDVEGPAAATWSAGQTASVASLRVDSGLLRFRLEQSGVVVTAASPVELDLLNPMRMRVAVGQVVADVGDSGKGFVVETPQGQFVDLGTTFGIGANSDSTTDLVVFKGKVQAYGGAARAAPLSTVIEGEAVRIGRDNTVARIANIVSGPGPGPWSTLPPAPERCVIASVRDNLRSPGEKLFYQIIPGGLRENVPAYVGPRHLWKGRTADGLPPYLIGADVVRTFPTDQGRKDLQITVRLSQPAKLYVLFETRPQQKAWHETPNPPEAPAWLVNNFHKIGDAVGLDDAGQLKPGETMSTRPGQGHLVTFDVWEREIHQPGEVTLGAPTGPEGWKNWMYGIAAKPLNIGTK